MCHGLPKEADKHAHGSGSWAVCDDSASQAREFFTTEELRELQEFAVFASVSRRSVLPSGTMVAYSRDRVQTSTVTKQRQKNDVDSAWVG